MVQFAFLFLLILVGAPSVIWAQELLDPAAQIAAVRSDLDYVWILASSALVFLMQAGFMALESGMARAKNSINIAIKNLADFVISVGGFWIVGFGLMFGASAGGWVGTSDFFMDIGDNSWRAAFFVFQAVFVGTAATIDSGAIAERTKFASYLMISAVTSMVIYPIFGHWAWGSFLNGETPGWLEARGFLDFAGSTVVHSVGGWVGLAGAIVLGPRIGRFSDNGTPQKIPPHNLLFVYLGTFILFFGWFGFNAGSTLAATPSIAGIALNTMLAAVFGAVSAGALSWLFSDNKLPEAETIANGVLAGLVGITAGCAFVEASGAVIIGLVSGIIMYAGSNLLERFGIDDVVGAIPVHGFSGAWGTLAVGLFITPEELNILGNTRLEQLGVQALGVGSAFVWTFGIAFVLVKTISVTVGMRVAKEQEEVGLNIAEHGATSSLIGLAESMREVARSGNYDHTFAVETEHGTEIGELAEYYNQMLEALIRQKEKIERADQKQKAAMARLTDAREEETSLRESLQNQREETDAEIQKFSELMDENVRAIGGELGKMNAVLKETGGQSAEMVTTFEEMVTNIEEMLNSFSHVTEATYSAGKLVSESTKVVRETSATVERLNTSAQEIGKITGSIEEIAERTRILSINAGIEAARAGNSGNGFRVVAQEVRQLADTTAESAKTIADHLGEISGISTDALNGIAVIEKMARELDESHRNISAATDTEAEAARQVRQLIDAAQGHVSQVRDSINDIQKQSSSVKDRVTESHTALRRITEEPTSE